MDAAETLHSGRFEWNEWRRSNPQPLAFTGLDLSGIDLTGCDLANVTFQACNLTGADLTSSWLTDAILQDCTAMGVRLKDARLQGVSISHSSFDDAVLSDAVLHNSQFIDVSLRRANLDLAQFAHSHLREVNLLQSRLTAADFRTATLDSVLLYRCAVADCRFDTSTWSRVIIADCDLRPAMGLTQVVHAQVSSLGVDTFVRSRGEVNRSFALASGINSLVADYLIEASAAAARNPLFEFHSVFLSHASHDKPVVNRVYDHLVEAGVPCWLDEVQMYPGDDIHARIARAVRLAHCRSPRSAVRRQRSRCG